MFKIIFFLFLFTIGIAGQTASDQSEKNSPAEYNQTVDELPPIEKLPEITHFQEAIYPAGKLADGIESAVTVEIIIDTSGIASEVAVLQSGGETFDSAAVNAIRQFRFSPAIAGGEKIPVAIEYTYSFTLAEAPFEIPETPNLIGVLIEKGTRNPVSDALVVAAVVESTVSDIPVPLDLWLERAGALSGQTRNKNELTTTTDSEGSFSFKALPPGKVILAFPNPGFKLQKATESIEPGVQREVLYRLERETYSEYEIIVYGEVEKKEVAKRSISLAEVKRIPGFGGDAIKVVQALPGVARPSFASGEILVRGSANEDSRYFLDGVNLPLLFHFGGVKSVYNSELLEKIDFYPGGFNVRYGGAVGGVIEITSRDAQRDRWHYYTDISTLDAAVRAEGPIGEKSGLALAGRYSYIGPVIETITEDLPTSVVPYYYDALARFDTKLSKNSKLFFSFLSSRDEVEIINRDIRFGSSDISDDGGRGVSDEKFNLGIFGWDHTLSDRFSNSLRMSAGYYNGLGSFFGFSQFNFETVGGYFRNDFITKFREGLTLTTGLDINGSRTDYDLNIMGSFGLRKNSTEMDQVLVGGYSFLEYSPLDGLLIMPGIRYDHYTEIDEGSASARLTTRYEYQSGHTIKGALGNYNQAPKPDGQAIDEAWGNPEIGSTQGTQGTLGYEWKINDILSLDVQGYYNTQSDIPRVTSEINPATGSSYNFFDDMDGRMYGAEILFKHEQNERFFGWMTYGISRSERRAPGPTEQSTSRPHEHDPDEWYLFGRDQTHNLQLLGTWKWPKNWETGFRFRYVTGNPESPLLSMSEDYYIFEADGGSYVNAFGDFYSERIDPFVQLDLRVDKRFIFKNWIMSTYLDVQNVAAFIYQSPEYYEYNYDGSERKAVGLPILPAFGITAEF